jgi:hypothetical protein
MREAFLHFCLPKICHAVGILVKVLGYQGIARYSLAVTD